MDYGAIADALAARFQAVTPPAGHQAIQVATEELPNNLGSLPALMLLPPTEDIEWLPSRQARSVQLWVCELYLQSSSDLARRMAAVTAWRTALVYQLAGQIQLGLSYVEHAYVIGLEAPQMEWGELIYDGLRITVRVQTREVVSGMSA